MNNRKKMDIRLEIIEELYEGDGRLAEHVRTERSDLLEELESMQSMKSVLDSRASHKPDAGVLDAVLRAAADASAGRSPESLRPGARQDRPPRARRALYLRSAGVATAVLTVLIAVTTVWQTDVLDGSRPLPDEKIAAEATKNEGASTADLQDAVPENLAHGEAARSAGSRSVAASPAGESAGLVRAFSHSSSDEQEVNAFDQVQITKMESDRWGSDLRVAGPEARRRPSDILPVGMRPMDIAAHSGDARELGATGMVSDEDLAWDQSADVMEMYQQIEMIGEGVARGWEPPSVPLEMVPASRNARPSGIQPAGERRTP